MNKLQKILSLLLAILLLQAPVLSLAEEAEAPDAEPEATEAPADVEFPEELIVGHPTITKGDFFTELFGNDTADIDVRALIHGYNLVNWDQNQGTYVMDPSVVTEYKVTMDEVGNKTYDMLIADDLYYSDGTQITAWDYAFSILLMMSPEIEDPSIGGKIYRAEHLLGYDDYIATRKKAVAGEPLDLSPEGDVLSLSGVEVRNDFELVITLDADFLPYFFETGLLMTVPYPIKVIAPGCKVYDEGFGVYIGNEDPNVDERVFTTDLLRATVMDPDEGYLSHPTVGSGPYVLTGWDGTDATFEINPYFKGDEDGNFPTIPHLRYHLAVNETMIEDLSEGRFGLLNKVTRGDTIQKGLELSGGQFKYQNYPRIGLTFIVFTPDRAAVQEKAVRKAIAHCLVKDRVTFEYCDRFGTPVDGLMGIGQWMYELLTGIIKVNPKLSNPPTEEELRKAEKISSNSFEIVL